MNLVRRAHLPAEMTCRPVTSDDLRPIDFACDRCVREPSAPNLPFRPIVPLRPSPPPEMPDLLLSRQMSTRDEIVGYSSEDPRLLTLELAAT